MGKCNYNPNLFWMPKIYPRVYQQILRLFAAIYLISHCHLQSWKYDDILLYTSRHYLFSSRYIIENVTFNKYTRVYTYIFVVRIYNKSPLLFSTYFYNLLMLKPIYHWECHFKKNIHTYIYLCVRRTHLQCVYIVLIEFNITYYLF